MPKAQSEEMMLPLLEREVDQYSLVNVPKCTERCNNWSVSNFEEWQRDCKGRHPGSVICSDILRSADCQELDEVQSSFILFEQSHLLLSAYKMLSPKGMK